MKLLIMNELSLDIFVCNSNIMPRIGDDLPFSYHPFPKVKSVCLNIKCKEKNIIEKHIKNIINMDIDMSTIDAVIVIG